MRRESLNQIKLSDREKEQIMDEIVAYYLDVRDEELGIIAKQQLLELFTEKLGPIIYNRALNDAKAWYSEQVGNLESDFYMLYKEN